MSKHEKLLSLRCWISIWLNSLHCFTSRVLYLSTTAKLLTATLTLILSLWYKIWPDYHVDYIHYTLGGNGELHILFIIMFLLKIKVRIWYRIHSSQTMHIQRPSCKFSMSFMFGNCRLPINSSGMRLAYIRYLIPQVNVSRNSCT